MDKEKMDEYADFIKFLLDQLEESQRREQELTGVVIRKMKECLYTLRSGSPKKFMLPRKSDAGHRKMGEKDE